LDIRANGQYVKSQVFVDETKAKGYLRVAAFVPSDEVVRAGRELRRLVLPGQRGLHMRDERDSRRHAIAACIFRMSSCGLEATIYDVGRRYPSEKARRARCLAALVDDAVPQEQVTLTLDLDESLVAWDRQQLIELGRSAGIRETSTYRHSRRSQEFLRAIPDPIA
jgi:hypothetical protein